jgi:hypothetical protein
MAEPELAGSLAAAAPDALGMVLVEESETARLAARFAPVLSIDTASDDDRIGAPYWTEDRRIALDLGDPVVFFHFSHTRFGARTLVQISYQAWFPARPKTGPIDLLGGWLDSVIWRVTIDPDGRPLIYDTIHGCGCYHLFFPVPPATLAPPPDDIREHPFAPAQAPALTADQQVRLDLASISHYLVGIGVASQAIVGARGYRLADASSLRSLPFPGGGRRSLYGPDGLVAGSERLERWLLWPMGVDSPGAMRQWGNHATVFVGRRHFDDARLLEQVLTIPEQ